MKTFIFFLLVLTGLLANGQTKKLAKGFIIDSVKIAQESNESYAIYLPNNYDASKLSPIVFIFDPGAQGKRAVQQFIKASEKYGHILVASNDSRNGPYERNFELANTLFAKIFADFKIDQKRVYTAGFSGGARLASTIAVLTKQIQGVIACGAGFSRNETHIPYTDSFSFVGMVGDEDMNLLEMYQSQDFISRLKIPNTLFVYEMNHRWPSQEQLLEAFDWLELEAMRKGLINVDSAYIKTSYQAAYQKARASTENDKLLYAVDYYKRILANYKGYYQLDSIQSQLNALEGSKTLLKEKKQLKPLFKEEITRTEIFAKRFREDLAKKKVGKAWWKSEISKLNKRLEKSTGNEKKMLKRLRYKIFAMAIETVNIQNDKTIDQRILCYDICIFIYPKYSWPYFKQIENYLAKNQENKGLDYLEALLNNGYTDLKAIKDYKPFAPLQTNERFKLLIKN